MIFNKNDFTKTKVNRSSKPIARMAFYLLILLLVNLNCAMPNKFWRSYQQKPFDSQKWRNGDSLERGTMFVDLFSKRKIQGKTREQVLDLLGEPDKRSDQTNPEIWHYKIELSGEEPIQYMPVTFDNNGKASIGATQKR